MLLDFQEGKIMILGDINGIININKDKSKNNKQKKVNLQKCFSLYGTTTTD